MSGGRPIRRHPDGELVAYGMAACTSLNSFRFGAQVPSVCNDSEHSCPYFDGEDTYLVGTSELNQ